MVLVPPSGPDWATIMTAIGTVAVAVVAVSVALFAEWRADKRVAAERVHSDKLLADERARHDTEIAEERRLASERLAGQLTHSDAQLAEERAHSAAQLQEEHRLAQEREQFAGAYAVQVTLMRSGVHGENEDEAQRLIAVIVNRSAQTITRIEVRFSPDGGSVIPARKQERLAVDLNLPAEARVASRFVVSVEARTFSDRLTPWDTGVTAETDPIGVQRLTDPRVVVRWTDRWGTRWEHKRSEVQPVEPGAQWSAQ